MYFLFFGGLAAKAVIYFNVSIYQVLINTLRLFARRGTSHVDQVYVCVCVCVLHKL